jgi:hypothetical protein
MVYFQYGSLYGYEGILTRQGSIENPYPTIQPVDQDNKTVLHIPHQSKYLHYNARPNNLLNHVTTQWRQPCLELVILVKLSVKRIRTLSSHALLICILLSNHNLEECYFTPFINVMGH